MPGFNLGLQGDEYLNGNNPSNTIELKRKYRWVFRVLGTANNGGWTQAGLLLLQSASRPSFSFEEIEMHHGQEVSKFAGKSSWEVVTLVWYDAEQPDISGACYSWLQTVILISSQGVAPPSQYKKQAQLAITNGVGVDVENWFMYGCWPVTVNWQELNYSSNEMLTCEATMRYDRAVRTCGPTQSIPGVDSPPGPSCSSAFIPGT